MPATEKDELAKSHLGLVHACCKRFSGKGIAYEELFSAGCLGLSKALNRFDSERGLQFSTYAFPVIMGEIKQLFRSGGTVKVSRASRELAIKVARLNNESIIKSGKELPVSRLEELLDVSAEQIIEAVNAAQAPLSLSADDENGYSCEPPSPDIQFEISERLTLQQALQTLPEDEQKIINLRYYRGKTQVQTAEILKMTQVQVSRREKKILAALREKIG